MRPLVLFMVLTLNNFEFSVNQILRSSGRFNLDEDDPEYYEINIVPDLYDDDEESDYNGTDKGKYVGAPCEHNCSSLLNHVICESKTGICQCQKGYPVLLNPSRGCGKPKRLGEQCYYRESCLYSDSHSSCIQVHHNAICQCDSGYHLVSLQRPSNRTFCAADVKIMTTDYSTLAGVLSGIALLAGLICFVLHLFNQNRYGRPHRFGNANIPPPIFFSNDAGFPLTVPIMDRGSTESRDSSQRTLASISSRRASSFQSYRGPQMIASSRAGSRRPSISSIHSVSSIRSYSARRFERDREMKEEREMQKRLAKMTAAMQANGKINQVTPSPRSTDELLPTLLEDRPVPLAQEENGSSNSGNHEELPSTSRQFL